MIDATERGCAHRPMSADGPRGECMSCLIDDRDHWRAAALAEGKAKLRAEARVRELEEENGRLRKLLHRWRCFDFDCPEEAYDDGTDTCAEDGAALELLYDDTGEALDAKIVECHPQG